MATYSIDDLKREIRIALDQNTISTQLTELEDVDTLSLNDIIESKILDAARIVETNAPTYLLGNGTDLMAEGNEVVWDSGRVGEGSGYIVLPSDFLRLRAFRMSDWERTVTTAISEDDPQYDMQSSRYAGIRGNIQRPIVAIVVSREEGVVLEFYSCNGGSSVTVKNARYIKQPSISDGYIDICEKLKPAIVYYAAYLVAIELKDDTAAGLLQTSKELMQ